MSPPSALLTLVLASATLGQPPEDAEYSSLERELDRAQEFIVKAETYTCQRDGARAALAPVRSRFEKLRTEAEALLGRRLNLDIWLNSCRRAGDGSQFRALLNKADFHLRKAARMVERGRAS